MDAVIEIQLADKFVLDYWFGELQHDECEIPRFQDVYNWISENNPDYFFLSDRVYAQVKSLYFP